MPAQKQGIPGIEVIATYIPKTVIYVFKISQGENERRFLWSLTEQTYSSVEGTAILGRGLTHAGPIVPR